MKVLQVISDTDRRGAQVFGTDLGEALERRGHDVLTVALAPARLDVRLDHRVLGRRRRSPGAVRELRELLCLYDVAIAHGSITLPATAIAAVGVPTPWVYRQIGQSLFWASSPARRARVRAFLGRATLIVALAPSAGEVLVEHLGVAADRIRVVPNGVPLDQFAVAGAAEQRAARLAFGLDPSRPVVAYVGALSPEKGVDIAVESVAAMPGVHLLVAGDGPFRPELERMAARCAPDRVHFVGVLDDVATAYAAADVLVLPSRGGDSMPAVVIEAGLCGRPTIGTTVGAIPDVVEAGVTGEIVRPDALELTRVIEGLLADPPRLAALGAQAREVCAARYGIDVVAAQWEAVLDDAVGLN